MRTRSPARLAPRVLAFLVDGLLLLALSTPLMWLSYREHIARFDDTRPLSLLINWALPALLCVVFWSWQGATPGKLVAGVRIIDTRTGLPPRPWQSLLRWLGYFVSALPLGLGLLWALIDPERQTWHDKLAGTKVVPRRPRAATDPNGENGEGEAPGYLAAHWRGEQSLLRSFWINHVLLSVPLALALTGLMSWISLKGEALQAGSIAMLIGWPLMLAANSWCIVGTWRAARAYRQGGGAGLWANLARLMLALATLQLLASALIGFLPQLGGYWQMARGIDPLGQAILSLSGDGRSLQLRGPIGMGDASRLKKLLAEAPQVRLFELASPGGRVYEAERMVELIRQRGSATRAIGDCASACTLVFLAGTQRQLMPGAQLGFHRASSGTYNPVFDEVANQELASTYRRMGLPEYFIERTARTPARSMWYPSNEELVSHALIIVPPLTLDVALPVASAAPAEYVDALRANPTWYQLEARYPGLLERAAARMQAARQVQAQAGNDDEDAAQLAALQVLAPRMRELIISSPPELRRRYLGVLKAQLQAALTADAAGAAQCQALLSGRLDQQRRLPAELRARQAAWLIAATAAPPPRWLPRPPNAIELEVVRRTLGAQAPGALSELWSDADDGARRGLPCARVIQLLEQAARLPVAQRELAERLLFQAG